MNSIWSNLYDRFRDRRNAAIFLLALLLAPFLALVILLVGAMAGICGLLLWGRPRTRGGEGENYSPLSSDELRTARSKLLKTRKSV